MYVRVWEYDVAAGREEDFERIYCAQGDWAQLFARSPGFVGTELFRAIGAPGRYVTVDRFTSISAWQAFLAEHAADYAELDRRAEGTTNHEQELAVAEQP